MLISVFHFETSVAYFVSMLSKTNQPKTKLTRVLLLSRLLFLVAFTGACAAQPVSNAETHALVEQANELINQNQYEQAFKILKPLADAGDLDANHKIAILYRSDDAKNPYYDIDKALNAYYYAANAGHAWAQIGLGQLLRQRVSHKIGISDLLKPESQEIWNKAFKESCMWYEKAARQGEGFAMLAMGHCYLDGYLTAKRDYFHAYVWFALAAGRFEVEAGDPAAPQSMAETFMQRAARNGKLTDEQVRQALNLAKEINSEISSKKTGAVKE